jgi:ATP-dependent exoDNAse (exonuclease V) alpha subunit
MAIYHCSIKITSRGKGKSAVAAAAYRSGEKITNDYDGITHDYTRKGGVVHTEILLSEHAPAEYAERSVLWNAVEKIEKAKNSQLAREIELALPKELSQEQNISLVRDYVQRNFVSAGMCADICLHNKNDGNPHAHILLTMRPIEQSGEWGAKSKKEYILDGRGEKIRLKSGEFKTRKISANDWNEPTKAEEWRAAWADCCNAALERQGKPERVDHRSFERQGVEQIPTIHLGVAATQMEKKGIVTDRGNINREIVHNNNILFAIMAQLKRLKDWLKEALTPKAPPTLAEVLQSVLDGGELHGGYGQIRDIKAVGRVLAFMKENGVSKMSELREVVSQKENRLGSIHAKLELLNLLRAAEQIVRELNRPSQQQQRNTRDRGGER